MVLDKLKKVLLGETKKVEIHEKEEESGYIEVIPKEISKIKAKVIIKPYVLEEFSDVKKILDDLREGYTIAFINIRPLKEKDFTELKRAITKIKKTVEALEGDMAGVGNDWIIATPSFAEIYRSKKKKS